MDDPQWETHFCSPLKSPAYGYTLFSDKAEFHILLVIYPMSFLWLLYPHYCWIHPQYIVCLISSITIHNMVVWDNIYIYIDVYRYHHLLSISTICPHDCWPNHWNRTSIFLLLLAPIPPKATTTALSQERIKSSWPPSGSMWASCARFCRRISPLAVGEWLDDFPREFPREDLAIWGRFEVLRFAPAENHLAGSFLCSLYN